LCGCRQPEQTRSAWPPRCRSRRRSGLTTIVRPVRYWCIVDAGGRRWLIAAIPDSPDPDASTHASGTATIYRWDGAQWLADGQIPNLDQGLNVSWRGGWFISVPQEQPGTVAFQLIGACCEGTDLNDYRSGRLITNAGGTWHVT
jgi:hypothetical protein